MTARSFLSVGAVCDCTILIWGDLIRAVSEIRAIIIRTWYCRHDCFGLDLGVVLIWAVIDCPYILNIEGFGLPAPTPTPTVGAVYDCTILIWGDLIRAVSEIRAIIIRTWYCRRDCFGLDLGVVGFDLSRFGLDLGGHRPPLHAQYSGIRAPPPIPTPPCT